MMQSIRVLLANQHPIIRANLRQLLEREHRYRVLGEAANGREAVMLSKYQSPDVVILDFKLPLLSGIETAREIVAAQQQTRTIFISGRADEEYVLKAFEAGGTGFVLSDAVQEDLPNAVNVVAAGGRFISPGILGELVDGCNSRCSPRESRLKDLDKLLLCWLAQGWTSVDVACALNVSSQRADVLIDETRRRSLQAGIPASVLTLIGGKVAISALADVDPAKTKSQNS